MSSVQCVALPVEESTALKQEAEETLALSLSGQGSLWVWRSKSQECTKTPELGLPFNKGGVCTWQWSGKARQRGGSFPYDLTS